MPLSFLDDKGPGAAEPGEPKDKKKEDHRQQILVIASLAGVVLAYITYKSIRSGSASASGTTVSSASVPNTTSGSVVGSGGDTDAVNGFTSYLQNLSGEVTQLQNTINTQANSTATLPATTSTTPTTSMSGVNWSAPAVTGDPYQDSALAASPYLSGVYQQYKADPTQATFTAYTQDYSLYAKQANATPTTTTTT